MGMWRDYLSGYIRNNRSSGLSIMIAAFISALFLSLLSGLFYQAWKYEVERIEEEEGGWQSRITGEFDPDDIELIRNYATVKDAVKREKAGQEEPAVDIYFHKMKRVLADTPRIGELVGVSAENIIYHNELLAMYRIRAPQDRAPRLLFPMFMLVMAMASLSLIVILYNSFAVSMNGRIHQFGIFSSIGASPRQIRACLMREAAVLCGVPVVMGNLSGIAGTIGILHMINTLLGENAARRKAVFHCHPVVLAGTLFAAVITIWISVWLPARKLSRLTPLEAIKTEELQPRRRKNVYLLTFLFGVEGELAGSALKTQQKALRTASLSFIFSFMAFTIMQCFFSMSKISTRETYFQRYQKVWDIMVTVKDTDADAFEEMEAVQGLFGVKNAIVYQKAAAKRIIAEEEISEEMKSFGGFSHAYGGYVTQTKDGWLVNAPIIILDDNSFSDYCKQIGIVPRFDGAVVRNQIRDVTNPDFRHPDFVPYLKGEGAVSNLRQAVKGDSEGMRYGDGSLPYEGNEERAVEIPVLAYAAEVPCLREEYAALDEYELVHFIPVSLWKEIKGKIGGAERDSYICILGKENGTLEELNGLQDKIASLISRKYSAKWENRIREYEENEKQIQGMMAIFGGFCVLLAVIGIGNVFSNTFGFVRQRKREFARYMSIGLTPRELRKMFCIEALAIAGRPILTVIPLAVIAVWYMLRISYLEAEVFMAEAPLAPIAAFMLAIFGSVALAYSFAWKNVRKINLAEVLKDDTMM